jgi:YesN/AraC family two-component response regulator
MSVLVISDSLGEGFAQSVSLPGKKVHVCPLRAVHEALQYYNPQAVVLDGGGDAERGLRLLRELKLQRPEVPVVFVSEKSDAELVVEAFRLGARDFFKKPINVFQLKETLENLLRLRRMGRERRHPYLPRGDELPALLQRATSNLPAGLLKSIRYMEEHLAEEITLEHLSSVADMSKHHFCRVFKRHLGISPLQFFIRMRVERAKELLKNRALSVSMVALEVGFNDISNFIKHFKKVTGITPSAFRKRVL